MLRLDPRWHAATCEEQSCSLGEAAGSRTRAAAQPGAFAPRRSGVTRLAPEPDPRTVRTAISAARVCIGVRFAERAHRVANRPLPLRERKGPAKREGEGWLRPGSSGPARPVVARRRGSKPAGLEIRHQRRERLQKPDDHRQQHRRRPFPPTLRGQPRAHLTQGEAASVGQGGGWVCRHADTYSKLFIHCQAKSFRRLKIFPDRRGRQLQTFDFSRLFAPRQPRSGQPGRPRRALGDAGRVARLPSSV